jgi:peptidoglycan/xylan/chitin deacetylase (PgdA/CDA1 family)
MSDPSNPRTTMCLAEDGLACDGTQWPPGFNTSATPRPRFGSIPYGERFNQCTVEGTLALTYDDGPSRWTADLLDILKANDVKATFFIRTYNLYADLVFHRSDRLPALIRRMYNEGHQIAGHTWEHKNMDLQLDSQQRRDEMTKQEMALTDILGFFPTYMRPPFNKCGVACKADMLELGYHIVSPQDSKIEVNALTRRLQTGNDIDGRDWEGNYTYARECFLEKITTANAAETRAWLSLSHDTHERTVHGHTQFMIDQARRHGYKLVTVGECLNDTEANWYRDPITGKPVHNLPPKHLA